MEDVGIGIFEERFDIFFVDDLLEGIERGFVFDSFIGGYYYVMMDGIKGVRGDIGIGGDVLIKGERGKEVVLEVIDKEDGFDGVVYVEVEIMVDDNIGNGRIEVMVEIVDVVSGESFFVDVDEIVELMGIVIFGRFGVVGQMGMGVVKGVDEEEGSGISGLEILMLVQVLGEQQIQSKIYIIGGKVISYLFGVVIFVFFVVEYFFEFVMESEV